MEPLVAAADMTWEFSVPVDGALGIDGRYARHEIQALTPQAALNVAQVEIDTIYGPGRFRAAQAVVLTQGTNRIIVERAR